jgi:phospholipid/cholesterol/gamma-HCH transport system ATP-binding protein
MEADVQGASPQLAAVRFEGVAKAFGSKVIFDDLELAIRAGEVITIVGGSGSGKSVMLKMMLGLVPADRGHVWVEDSDVSALGDLELTAVRRRIGMLFQGGALFDSMSVFDNVSYALVERGEKSRTALAARVREVLAMVGLPGTEELMPSELSGGMKKRVALARAVAEVPRILLYDEPTTGLDPLNVRRISELILRLRDELHVTSVVVTHDLGSAFMISDRMAMLARARIMEVSDTARFRASGTPEVRDFLGAMDGADAHTEAP